MRGYRVLFRGAAHVPRGFGLSRWRLRHISDGTILAFEFHMPKTDAILNLPEELEWRTEFVLLSPDGEVLSYSRSVGEAADLLGVCLDNIPASHPTPGLYMRAGAHCVALAEAWSPDVPAEID